MTWRMAGLLLGTAIVLSHVPDAAAQPQKLEGPELSYPVHMDVSPPLRYVVPLPPDPLRDKVYPAKRLPLPRDRAPGSLTIEDTVLQSTVPAPLDAVTTPTFSLNFDGVGIPNYAPCGSPPDPNGAVGATQYVQWVNC